MDAKRKKETLSKHIEQVENEIFLLEEYQEPFLQANAPTEESFVKAGNSKEDATKMMAQYNASKVNKQNDLNVKKAYLEFLAKK